MDADQLPSDHIVHLVVPDSIQLRQSGVYPKQTGAWCIIPIKEGTLLGPYQGKVVLEKDIKDLDYRYAWQIYDESTNRLLHVLNASRAEDGNWMRYVNCARYLEEQNIFAVQEGLDIFYKAMKDIPAGEELLTWFAMNKRKRRRKQNPTDAEQKPSGQTNTLDDMMPKVKKRQKKPKLTAVDPISESNSTKLKSDEKLTPLNEMSPVPISTENIKVNSASKLSANKVSVSNVINDLKTDGARRGTRRKKCKIFTDSILIGEGRIMKRQLKLAMKRDKKLDDKTKIKMAPIVAAHEKAVKSETNEIATSKVADFKVSIESSEMNGNKQVDRVEAEVCYRYTLTPDQRGMDASGTPMFMCDVCDVDYRHSFSLKRHYLRCHINYKYLSNHDVLNCMINLKSQTVTPEHSTVSDPLDTKPLAIKRKRRRSKIEMEAAKNGTYIKRDDSADVKVKCLTKLSDTLPTATNNNDCRPGLFWCNICHNLFDHLNDLKMHIALHTAEERPSEYLYSCSKCEQQFSSKETLLDHVCQIKAVIEADQRANMFPCSICGKTFTAKVNLRQHLLVHESARHRCKYCGLRYKKPKPLRIHMRKVHHEKFYKCPGCRKWFTSVKRFRVHKKLPKCKDAVVKAAGKIRETVQKGFSGNSPLGKKSSIQQYMSPRKFFTKRIESNEVDISQNKDSMPMPRRHPPKTKFFKKLCPAVFGLTKSKPCVVCPLCKVQVHGPFSSCTHKRNLDHSDDPMESFLDDSRNDRMNATNECTAEFFANVAYNIADNLNTYIDGKCDALSTFAKHIQIEDYTSLFSCPQMEEQQLSLSKYNFHAGLSSLCGLSQEAVISEPLEIAKNFLPQELLPLDLSAVINKVKASDSLEPYKESLTTTIEHTSDENEEKLKEDISSLNFEDDDVCCRAWTDSDFGVDKSENKDIENISTNNEDSLIKNKAICADTGDCPLDCSLKSMNAYSIHERTENQTVCLTSEKQISPQPAIGHDILQYTHEATEGCALSDVKHIIDDILNNIPCETPRLSFPNIEGKAISPSHGLTRISINMAESLPLSHEDFSDENLSDDFPSNEMPNEEEVPPPLTLMVENVKSPSCGLDMLSDEDCRSPPLLCMMFSKLERETVGLKCTNSLIIEDISDCDSVHSSSQVAKCDKPEIATNSREECALTVMNSQDTECMNQEPSSSALNSESTNVESEEPLNLVCCDIKEAFLSCSNDFFVNSEEESSLSDLKASTPKDEELSTNVDSIPAAEKATDWCLISNSTKQLDEIAFGKQGELIYVCDVCARQFQTHLGLLKHQGRKHPSVNCRYLLVEQGHHINKLHFPNASAIGVLSQSSIANTCMKNVDKYSCTKCEVQFSSLSRLHVHIISCAPKSDKPPAISDVKTTEIKLKKKMRDIQSGKGKIRFCLRDLSGYKSALFKETSIEQNNKIMGNGKKSAVALPEMDNKKVKGRSYDLPYNPKKHIRRRDLTEVLERQKCGGCGLKFKTISLLERHIRKCTEKDRLRAVKPNSSPRYNEKHSKLKHVCRYCHREFTYLKSIVNHYKEFCSVRRVLEQEGKLTASNLKDEAMIAAIVNSQDELLQANALILAEADAEGKGKVQKGWLKGRKRKWRKKNHSWTYIKKKKDVENKTKSSLSVREQPSRLDVEVNIKREPTDHHLEPKPEVVLPENNDVDLSLPENNGLDKQDEQVNLSIKNKILPKIECQVVGDRQKILDETVSSENHDVQISIKMTDANTSEQNICFTDRMVLDDNQITFIKREPEIILDLLDSSRENCASQVANKPILSLHGKIAAQTLLVDSPDSDISR